MFASKMHAMYTSHASAHTADAAFSCPRCASMDASSNIAMILDASLLLASIIILPIIILVHHFPICRIPVQRPVSLSIL